MYAWTYLDSNGNPMGASGRFEDADSAESWLGMSWQGLAEFGVEEVELHDHSRGERVYRMGLAAE